MKKFAYILLSALIAVSLSGCTAASKQASAVKDSMKTITAENILFEHVDLGNIKSQLKEQSEGKPDGTGTYTLKVNVSSVAAINAGDLSVPAPAYDLKLKGRQFQLRLMI